MKTEYIACINLTFEIVWIKRFLADLKEINDNPIKIMCDNQVAIYITKKMVGLVLEVNIFIVNIITHLMSNMLID